MKNKDYKVVNIYTQANGEKIAVSMLKCTKKSFWVDIAPTTEVEKYGKIEGEIVSHWGKLPVVLVTVPEFKALKKEYEVEEYRAPYYRQSEREKKPRPDAAALKLYKVFATDEANPQRDEDGNFIKITVDNYTFYSGEGAWMLKELKRNFNFTKADIAAALALNIDEPQQQPEPAAAVEDIEAAVVAHFEDLAAHAPADDPAADIEPIPASEKTEPAPAPAKKRKELAEYHGAIVEVLGDGSDDNTALIKIKGGARLRVEKNELQPTTAKKTALPDWLCVDGMFKEGEQRFIITRVGNTTFDAYDVNGNGCYCNGDINSLLHRLTAPGYSGHIVEPLRPEPTPANQKPAATDAEVLATAARIRANYEAIQADIEAEREQGRAAFAEAITAYCEELEQPAPLAWEPETIIVPFTPRAAEVEQQPRRRHRLNLRPRLSRLLHPARWVAVAFVVCLLSGLLLGMNTSTAAADDIAAAYDLAPVTVTAEAPDTFIEDEAPCLIEDKAPCLIEDEAPAPSPVKKLAAPSPVKNVAEAAECSSQKTDAADYPAGEKTASPMATATDAAGLTICEGTPWAYTMMNWA